jgi:D-sedoheptulose 7-phosphate isomerase
VRETETVIQEHFEHHAEVLARVRSELVPRIGEAAEILVRVFRGGGKVLILGNGGSMADALHIEGELSGRYLRDREALPAIAIGAGLSATTAIANDLGFDQVFARPVRGLARSGDAVIALSTSGRSSNVLEAVRAARHVGAATIGLTGRDGGELARRVDCPIVVPSPHTPTIQEFHIAIGHILCRLVEDRLFGEDPSPEGRDNRADQGK